MTIDTHADAAPLSSIKNFESQILFFNGMYGLPINPVPGFTEVARDEMNKHSTSMSIEEAVVLRLKAFKKVISDEVIEVDDIIEKIEKKEYETPLDALTDLADWLGDMQIYCASEMVRYGIPINESLKIIMASNFSKLGSDGKAIMAPDGSKVMKGPNYWKPEPALKMMLAAHIVVDDAVAKTKEGASNEPSNS